MSVGLVLFVLCFYYFSTLYMCKRSSINYEHDLQGCNIYFPWLKLFYSNKLLPLKLLNQTSPTGIFVQAQTCSRTFLNHSKSLTCAILQTFYRVIYIAFKKKKFLISLMQGAKKPNI